MGDVAFFVANHLKRWKNSLSLLSQRTHLAVVHGNEDVPRSAHR